MGGGGESQVAEAELGLSGQLFHCCCARARHGHRRHTPLDEVGRKERDTPGSQDARHLLGDIHSDRPEEWTAFIAVIQLGTLIAVILYFLSDIIAITRGFVTANLGILKKRPITHADKQNAWLGWLVIIGTLPFTQVGVSTSEGFLAASLVVRGIGMGFTMMPAISAAYARLSSDAIARATPMINIVQRVGGSFGTALFAVVLQRSIASSIPSGAGHVLSTGPAGTSEAARKLLADSFGHTFWWVVGCTVVGIVPALFLPRHGQQESEEPEVGTPEAVAVRAGGPDGI